MVVVCTMEVAVGTEICRWMMWRLAGWETGVGEVQRLGAAQ